MQPWDVWWIAEIPGASSVVFSSFILSPNVGSCQETWVLCYREICLKARLTMQWTRW